MKEEPVALPKYFSIGTIKTDFIWRFLKRLIQKSSVQEMELNTELILFFF